MAFRLPRHACNSHCHVFGPASRFPYATGGAFTPSEDKPKEDLYALNDHLGLTRCVVVQSSCHGFDNSATEDAIAGRPLSYRGVALLRPDVPDTELRRLDKAGFRAVRFNYMTHLGAGTDPRDVLRLAQRIADLGWHLQIHGDPDRVLGEIAPALLQGPTLVVIDHVGRIDASLGLQQAHVTGLKTLMDSERCWLKVSGADRITKSGPPYIDAQPIIRDLVRNYSDRVLWGSDWPHPNHAGPIPNDADLLDLVSSLAPRLDLQEKLLVTNPGRLYRFGD